MVFATARHDIALSHHWHRCARPYFDCTAHLGHLASRKVNALKAAISYYRLRASWLGDGGAPVPLTLATSRSLVCLKCPLNEKMPLWEVLTTIAATHLRKQLALKASMQLAVPGEDGLHTCKACLCHLPSKVFVPIKHIKETMPLEALSALHERCWILAELDTL